MKKINILMLSMGLVGFGTGINSALSQTGQNENVPGASTPSGDAVLNAQTVRDVPATRPEQKKNEHDRSNVFDAQNAMPASPAFNNQPDKGKVSGFDFARDPFNAKKPMQTFEETMKADIADRPKVMRTQQELLQRRYDLTPRLDREAKMTRGKPLAVGPTARLPAGVTWERLAAMSPAEIRSKNVFPYPSLPHPKQATGGQVFPQMQTKMFPRLERFDVGLNNPVLFVFSHHEKFHPGQSMVKTSGRAERDHPRLLHYPFPGQQVSHHFLYAILFVQSWITELR